MRKILSILFVSVIAVTLLAQTKQSNFGVALGVSASTNGLGVSLNTALNKTFALRLGYEKVDQTFENAFVYAQGDQSFNVTPTWKAGGLSAILDIYLLKGLYLSGGVVFTNLNLSANLMSGSSIMIGDIEFQPDELGSLGLTLTPEKKMAPYGALGFGRNISRDHRLAMSFEIGTYYMGSYVVGLTGTKLFEANGEASNQESLKDLNETLKGFSWSGFYPVIKLGISYKIFGTNK